MGRLGITYQDVTNAANQVKTQNKNVTIENVRAILGTGSISTINTHLRRWKQEQSPSHKFMSKEKLPEELTSLLQTLWGHVVNQSAEYIASIENNYQNTISKLQQELEKYKTNNQRWQKLFSQWQEEQKKLLNEKMNLEKMLQEKQNRIETLEKNELLA